MLTINLLQQTNSINKRFLACFYNKLINGMS